MIKGIRSIGVLALLAISMSAGANPINSDTCGDPGRVATMTGAEQCAYAPYPGLDTSGTMSADDIAHFFGETWNPAGELTDNGTNGYLSATSDAGWGQIPNSGTWAIDASFWDNFEYAVITMHVGAGQVDPYNWAWLMADGVTAGTWSLNWSPNCDDPTLELVCNGGGLSNIKLWGAGRITVSEPGTLALFGIGLIGLGLRRRRASSR